MIMRVPHRLVVITPIDVADEYGNPTPRLDYGPTAPRRTMPGLMEPTSTQQSTEAGRQAITATWRLFTAEPIAARERIEWNGRLFAVQGEPARWSPRFGHTHYETTLIHVDG